MLLPAPYWVSYTDEIRLAEATPVVVTPPEESRFRITPEHLEPHVTPRTAGLIINSPSNPTGILYDAEEIAALVDFAEAEWDRRCALHDPAELGLEPSTKET